MIEADRTFRAPLAELVDAPDSKSGSERSAGSIPARGTIFLSIIIHDNPYVGSKSLIFQALPSTAIHDCPPTANRFGGMSGGATVIDTLPDTPRYPHEF